MTPPQIAETVPLPTRLHLELTNRCNSLCQTCVRTMAPVADCDMRLVDVDRIVGGLPQLRSVALQVNGEPLLHQRLPDIVSHLTRRGIFVELNTNGIALRHRRARSLIGAGLDRLNVSVDAATRETYRVMRGIDALDRVVAGLTELLDLRGPAPATPRVSLWMTATRHNLPELPGLVELAARVGADEVHLQRLVHFEFGVARAQDSVHGRAGQRHRDIITAATRRADELGIELRSCGGHRPEEMLEESTVSEPWRSCRRAWEGAVVMANGDVVPCCICSFIGSPGSIRMGNVLSSSWASVWNGSRYQHHRAALRDGTAPDYCRQCGVSWSL